MGNSKDSNEIFARIRDLESIAELALDLLGLGKLSRDRKTWSKPISSSVVPDFKKVSVSLIVFF